MTPQMARALIELIAMLLSGGDMSNWACWESVAGYWHANQPWAYTCEYQGTEGRLPYGLHLEQRERGGVILYVDAAG